MPLKDLGFRVKLLSRVEIESRVGPKVRDRARYKHLVALALQKEITGRGHAANDRALFSSQRTWRL